ncbi:hypothetical protein JS578_10965 [Dysgonomonadaceae bacterium zrk40]|nr:hypothetical protein JS578_10965 [Dysgonomonadaceae bacterium zrk40]
MRKIVFEISDAILRACPDFRLAAISCKVKNNDYNEELWKEINHYSAQFASSNSMEKVKLHPAIRATREAYKRLGKDPNRYRPSAEALCRRILKGQELYQINTLVDLINLVSLKTGYSIGGFDLDRIGGNLILGVGEANERFEAIGRGLLNIEGLPVYRDDKGSIGTPTSDEERTKITTNTAHLLMIINAYSGKEGLQEAVAYSINLLNRFVDATSVEVTFASIEMKP